MDIKQDIANVPKYEKNFTTPGKVGMVTEHSVDEIKANYYLYDLGETQKMVTDFNRVAAGIASENNGHTVTADDMNEVLTQQGYNPLKPEVWNAMKRAEELKAKGQTPGKSLTNKERKEIQEKLKYVRNNL